jgi:hypothetical protein
MKRNWREITDEAEWRDMLSLTGLTPEQLYAQGIRFRATCRPGAPEWAGWDSFVGDPEWWDGWVPINGKARPGSAGRYYPRFAYPREEDRQARRPPTEEKRTHRGTHPRVGSIHHRTLGVRPSATREEIRSAYRALAMRHHPDHGGSVEKMREINAAYHAIIPAWQANR